MTKLPSLPLIKKIKRAFQPLTTTARNRIEFFIWKKTKRLKTDPLLLILGENYRKSYKYLWFKEKIEDLQEKYLGILGWFGGLGVFAQVICLALLHSPLIRRIYSSSFARSLRNMSSLFVRTILRLPPVRFTLDLLHTVILNLIQDLIRLPLLSFVTLNIVKGINPHILRYAQDDKRKGRDDTNKHGFGTRILAFTALIAIVVNMALPFIDIIATSLKYKVTASYTSITVSKSGTYRFEATNPDLQAFFGDTNNPNAQRFAISKNGSTFDLRLTEGQDKCPLNTANCNEIAKNIRSASQAPVIDFASLKGTSKTAELARDLEEQLEQLKAAEANTTPSNAGDPIIRSAELIPGAGTQHDRVQFLRAELGSGVQGLGSSDNKNNKSNPQTLNPKPSTDLQIDYSIITKGVKQTLTLSENSLPTYQFLLHLDGFQVIKAANNEYVLVDTERSSIIQIGKPVVRDQGLGSRVEGLEKTNSLDPNPQTLNPDIGAINIFQDPRGIIMEIGVDQKWFADQKRAFPITLDTNFIISSPNDKQVEALDATFKQVSSSKISALQIQRGAHGYLYEHLNNYFQIGLGTKESALSPKGGKTRVAFSTNVPCTKEANESKESDATQSGKPLTQSAARDSSDSSMDSQDCSAGIEMLLLDEKQNVAVRKNTKLQTESSLIDDMNALVETDFAKFKDSDKKSTLVDSITAEEVQNGMDVEYKVLPQGLKEDIILKYNPILDKSLPSLQSKEATAATEAKAATQRQYSFSYALNAIDAVPQLDKDSGIWKFFSPSSPVILSGHPGASAIGSQNKDSIGRSSSLQNDNAKPLFSFPAPFAKDAAGISNHDLKMDIKTWDQCGKYLKSGSSRQASNNNEYSSSDSREVPHISCYKVTVSVDAAWLTDAAYPVVIDPSIVDDTTAEFTISTATTSPAKNRVFDTGSGASPVLETYYQELPTDINTLGLWHINEGSGTAVADATGNGNTGAFNGSPTWNTASASILGASSMSFNGSSTGLLMTNTTFPTTYTNFTVEAWFNTTTVAAGTAMIVTRNTASTDHWLIRRSTNTVNYNMCNGSACIGYIDPGVNITTNTWYHVAMTYDGANVMFYFNGKHVSTTASTITTGNTSGRKLGIGCGLNSSSVCASEYFSGSIDEVRYSNNVRSPEEIRMDAQRRPYSVFTSSVFDLTSDANFTAAFQALTWTENGVKTADGETLADSTSLIAQWNLNSSSGTTTNSNAGSCGASCLITMTNMSTGTNSQDALAGSGWTTTNKRWGSGAVMFDGTDDYALCTDANCGGTTLLDIGNRDWSIEAWVKSSKTASMVIISKGTTASYSWQMSTDGNGFPQIVLFDNTFSTYISAKGTTRITDGQWHYLAGTWTVSGTTAKFYVDGKLERTTTTTSANPLYNDSTAEVQIGRRGDNPVGTNFQGVIDSIRVYARALTANEIAANSNNTNLELQTRTGSSSTPNDGTWEAWKPSTSETQIDSMDGPYQYNTTDSGLVSYWPMDETYNTAGPLDALTTAGTPGTFAVNTAGTLTGGLKSFWKLDESSGTLAGDAAGFNNMQATGSTVASAKLNNGRTFATGSNYLTTSGTPNLQFTDNISISLWFNRAGSGSSGYTALVGRGADTTTKPGDIGIVVRDSDSHLLVFRNGGSTSYDSGYVISNSAWNHIVVTVDGTGAINVYRNNGAPASTTGFTLSTPTSPLSFSIGRWFGLDSNATIDEVGVWNKVLTATEVSNLYNSGSADSYSGTAGSRFGNNGSPFGTTITDGKFGKSRGFDGTDDEVNMGTPSSLSITGSLTVEAWVKTTGASTTTIAGNWKQNTPASSGFALFAQSGSTIQASISTGVTSITRTSTRTINDNLWHHVAFVYDASGQTLKTYTDGQEDSGTLSGAVPASINSATVPFAIGSLQATASTARGLFFPGNIDEVRVYNSAQAASTLQQHYLEGITGINGASNVNVSTDTSMKYEGTGSQRMALGAPKVDSKTVGLWHLDETNSSSPIVDATSVRKFSTDSTGNLTNGLAAYWKMDESANDTCPKASYDLCDSVSKNDAYIGAGTISVTAGKLGNGRDFDGTAGWASAYDNPFYDFTDTEDLTISGWFNRDTFTTDDTIIANRAQSSATVGLIAYIDDADDKLYFKVSDGTDEYRLVSTSTFTSTGWNHFVAVWDEDSAANSKIYINGVNDNATATGTIASVNALSTASELILGSENAAGNYFDGKLDEMGLWRRAISSSEVTDLYNSGNANAYLGTSGYTGTLTGTSTDPSLTDGYIGKARTFDASNDQIDLGSWSYSTSNSISISAWVKVTTCDGSYRGIVHVGATGFHVTTAITGSCNLAWHRPGTDVVYESDIVVPTNTWIHVAMTQNGTTMSTTNTKLYINGVQATSIGSPGTQAVSYTGNTYIGRNATSSVSFGGTIDEVNVSNVVRSYDEIQEAYRAGRDQRIGKNITSTDLSSKLTQQYAIAADRPGTYMEATVGESAYANYEPDANTVGLWHLEESNGTGAYLKDSSGYANNATPTGTTSVAGKYGKGRNFGGTSSDYLTISDATSLDVTTLTLEVWIKFNAVSPANNKVITWKGDDAATGAASSYWFNMATTNKIDFFIGNNVTTNSTQSISAVLANQWYHLVGTADGSNVKIYVNGTLESSTAQTITPYNSSNSLRINGIVPGQTIYNVNATYDEIRLSNTARSADDIRQAFEIGKRTHPITIDFASNLQAAYSSGTSMTANVMSGQDNLTDSLKVGDTILVKENVGGVEYIGSSTVAAITNTSTRSYGTITLSSQLSLIPPSGFTTSARVFKWQREYMDLSGITQRGTHDNAITRVTIRVTDGSQGSNVWLDDIRYAGNYLTTSGSTPTSTGNRYYQYRVIETTSDPGVSSNFAAVTQNYTAPPSTGNILRNGVYWINGAKQSFWWGQ